MMTNFSRWGFMCAGNARIMWFCRKKASITCDKTALQKKAIKNYDIMTKFLFEPANHNTKNHWGEELAFLQPWNPKRPPSANP